jgi:Putative GTPase activating protein for Arf
MVGASTGTMTVPVGFVGIFQLCTQVHNTTTTSTIIIIIVVVVLIMADAALHEMPSSDRIVIESLPGNSVCMECGTANPEWASVTLAVVLCLDCSGRHRGLGTHLSFVRSITMDSWTEKQLLSMKAGGNQACKDFLSQHTNGGAGGVVVTGHNNTLGPLSEKYDTPAAELYRQVLKARVEGKPEPTELPPPTKRNQTTNANWQKQRPLQGFGSGPHPAVEDRKRKQQQQQRTMAVAIGVVGFSVAAVAAGILWKQ